MATVLYEGSIPTNPSILIHLIKITFLLELNQFLLDHKKTTTKKQLARAIEDGQKERKKTTSVASIIKAAAN